ncbi:FAD binding domain protein [Aspergillus insuetus]
MANFEDLAAQLKGHGTLLLPGDEGFERSLYGWSDLSYRCAAAVVHPRDSEGVAATVRFARAHAVDLAVRGGAHSTAVTSSTEGGILIDLGKGMTEVTVDPDARTVTVQGGAKWGDVSKEVGKHPLSINGGTVSMVGVGGLSLRGGYAYFAPQHGLVLDTILSAEVVVGTGEILKASPTENLDLLWAVKGAGPNIGAVCEISLQAYPQSNKIWYGLMTYPAEETERVAEALNKSLRHPHGKAAAQLILHLKSEDLKTPIVSTVLFFDGPEEEARSHFSELLKLEFLTNEMKMTAFAETNTALDPFVPAGGRKKELGFQLTLPPRPGFVVELRDRITAKLANEPDLAHSSVEVDYFDPSKICSVPVTDTSFPTRYMMLHGTAMLQWNDSRNDEDFLAWGESIQKLAERELLSHGEKQQLTVSTFVEFNQDNKRPPHEMFGENTDRLLELKAKYDPDNIFNKQDPIV